MATLHHQLVFRLQNHSLDLPNQGSRDAPMVLANSGTEIPTIIQIPRQIQRKDLEKLVPTEWITNYESLQQQHETVKSTDFRFKRLPDGRVKTIFKTQPDGQPSNPEFQLMITPIPVPKKIVTPVASFGAEGHRIYTDRINGHFIWDVNPSMCDPECSCEEDDDDSSDDEDNDWSDYESDEDDDLSSCHDSDDDYDEPDPDERRAFRKPQSCMMFQYETDFPPMERPPRQGGPLGRGMGKEALSQLNSLPTCSGEGYVGLPAALGIRARLPFPAGARRNLGSACEREEGCETVSRGDEPHTIDMDTHIDNSIGNVDQLLHVASTLSLPKITSSSVDNLVQYSTIPESAIVENTVPPVISPYNLYRKKGSLSQGIRALIASKKHMNQKEQVHSSKMDHCSLPASTKEQYVTLSIPPDYISGWKAEGYTHLHLGAVRLVLSYHGRKGLPVTARIALLDTRFLEYEHAVIGTVLTTLNAGSIVVTFFPNFAVSLSDPHVASAFKVQVQITGANQVPASVMATLHHQLVFRLQNHSLDLPNQGSRDAPMVLANSGTEIPTIIQIPRQIQRKDLEKLVPTEWITNYESLQQQHETVKSTDFRFKRLPDGRVKTIFKTQPDGETFKP
ncbi:UNVERIFIED_CONTAM: polyprotein [Sesamum radiatum]|uniref:Polyprotein n=1 Tax=Sesamum radiatum TaxID=300843 RepID=A0AAW2J5Y6_SESRA